MLFALELQGMEGDAKSLWFTQPSKTSLTAVVSTLTNPTVLKPCVHNGDHKASYQSYRHTDFYRVYLPSLITSSVSK